jgi:hypothetical protein
MTASQPSAVGRFLREPLVHFLLFGAAIYLVYALQGQPAGEEEANDRTVVVSTGEIAWMLESWEKRWGRPPTQEELDGMIREYAKETILYREAIAMGLDKDDIIIRRRMAQKLTFMFEDLLQPKPPSGEQLQAYFEENIDAYSLPARITMTQVFIDPDKHGDQTLEYAAAMKTMLERSDDPVTAGRAAADSFMLQVYHPERVETELARDFGSEFARSVFELEPGKWHGPVLSGYGTHLVYVSHRTETQPQPFTDVEATVLQNWQDERRVELNEQFVANLIDRYQVVVEEIPADAATTTAEAKR